MIDTGLLIATGCGVLSTGMASFFTWLFSKRKYNSEVDSNNIENMQKSLDFYIKLSDDYKSRLDVEIKSHHDEVDELRKENAELKKEMREQEKKFNDMFLAQQKEISAMKNQMLSVYSQVCLNFKCAQREAVSAEQIPVKKARKRNVHKEV